ncbi:uncharacterized protein RP688-like [Lineus longissimus]|uniref:uncharacterized protein RP688-like n=1 Tax=Lineus longissimus TaxID=88925 RepID=UPI00315DA9C0
MFDEMCKRHQITYFIYGGTLLGSFRHHDLISWDDDVDVIIPVKQKPLLIDAMQNIENKYKLVTTSREHFKIYSKQKSEIMNLYFDWAWPYLDVSFYGENSTHIWDIAETYGRSYEYQKGYIFPLHLRPLGKLWLPSPRDSYAYLYYTYGASDDCAMNHYVHKIEMVVWCKELKRKCNKLKHKYPFVFREEAKGGVKETLKMNGTVIHSYIVHEPTYAVTKPYSLFLDEKVYRKHFNKG